MRKEAPMLHREAVLRWGHLRDLRCYERIVAMPQGAAPLPLPAPVAAESSMTLVPPCGGRSLVAQGCGGQNRGIGGHDACDHNPSGGGLAQGTNGNGGHEPSGHALVCCSMCMDIIPADVVCLERRTSAPCCTLFIVPSIVPLHYKLTPALVFSLLLQILFWACWAILYSLATLLASFSSTLLVFCLSLSLAFFALFSSLFFCFCSFSCCILSLFVIILSRVLRCCFEVNN